MCWLSSVLGLIWTVQLSICLAWCLPTETLPFVATIGMCWVFLELGSLPGLLALPRGPWISPGVAYAHALPAWSWNTGLCAVQKTDCLRQICVKLFPCCFPIYRSDPPLHRADPSHCMMSLGDPQWWSSCF